MSKQQSENAITLDSEQDWTVESLKDLNGETSIVAYRNFTSIDSNDVQFEFSQETQIIQFATADDASLQFAYHGIQYEKVILNLEIQKGNVTTNGSNDQQFSTTQHETSLAVPFYHMQLSLLSVLLLCQIVVWV